MEIYMRNTQKTNRRLYVFYTKVNKCLHWSALSTNERDKSHASDEIFLGMRSKTIFLLPFRISRECMSIPNRIVSFFHSFLVGNVFYTRIAFLFDSVLNKSYVTQSTKYAQVNDTLYILHNFPSAWYTAHGEALLSAIFLLYSSVLGFHLHLTRINVNAGKIVCACAQNYHHTFIFEKFAWMLIMTQLASKTADPSVVCLLLNCEYSI